MPISLTRSRAPALTPALLADLEAAISKGTKPSTAAQLAGIPSRTWESWIAIAEGRQQTYSDGSLVSATQRAFLAPLAEVIERGRAVLEARVTQTLMDAGDRELASGGLDWRAHEAIMKRHPLLKRDWSEYREVKMEQGGTIRHEHRMVQQLPEQDVIDLAGPEWAAMVPPRIAESDEPVSPA